MRKILFAVLALAAGVMAEKSYRHASQRDVESSDSFEPFSCSKSCAVEMGKCILKKKDVDTCLSEGGDCTMKCVQKDVYVQGL